MNLITRRDTPDLSCNGSTLSFSHIKAIESLTFIATHSSDFLKVHLKIEMYSVNVLMSCSVFRKSGQLWKNLTICLRNHKRKF